MEILEKVDLVKVEVKKYFEKSKEYDMLLANTNKSQEEHIINIGTSILCTKWNIGYPGGSFVQAVVNNNLTDAFATADATNTQALKFYCQLIYNVGIPSKLINNL